MKTPLLLPTLAIVIALGAPALAQTGGGAVEGKSQPSAASSQQNAQNDESTNKETSNHEGNVLTINKLKEDLQKAGFTDVKILGDSFLVQAKDKAGNPTIMSLSPSGVVAISEISHQRQAKASNMTSGSSGSETQRR